MSRFNTGNPIGSADVKDLSDNAKNFDIAENSVTEEAWIDRLGKLRKTWFGIERGADAKLVEIEEKANRVIASLGFLPPVPYAPGLSVDSSNFTVEHEGVLYFASPSETPFVTGVWDVSQWSPLQNTFDQNTLLIFQTLAEAENASTTLPDGSYISVLETDSLYQATSGELEFIKEGAYKKFSGDSGSSFIGYKNPQTGAERISVERKLSQITSLDDFSAIADGISDDALAINSAVAAAALSGNLVFGKNKTYRSTKQIPIPFGMRIDLNGSVIDFNFDDTLENGCGFLVQSSNVSIVNGSINVDGSKVGLASSAHVPIYGGREDTGLGYENLTFKDLSLKTNGNGAIVFMGENRNVDIDNISIADSSKIRVGIAFEWGGTPAIGTLHPHNISIRNIKAGRFTFPGEPSVNHTCVVWISSAFNVKLENISAVAVPTVVNIFTGDKSNTFAPESYKHQIGTNINAVNISCGSVTGYGVRVYGKASESEIPLDQSVSITGLSLKASSDLALTHMGVLLEFCEGVKISNFKIDGFFYGIATGADVLRPVFESGSIINCQFNGASLGATGYPTISPVFRDVKFTRNNAAETVGIATAAALRVTDTRDALIDNCKFGTSGVNETQRYSIYLSPLAQRPILNNNHTYSIADSGVAYVVGDAQSQTEIEACGANNTASNGINLHGGAPIFTVKGSGLREWTSTNAPTSGSWRRGDTVLNTTPSIGAPRGWVCVTSGTPGTWVSMGNL